LAYKDNWSFQEPCGKCLKLAWL